MKRYKAFYSLFNFIQRLLKKLRSAPACQLCVGDGATLRVGEVLPVRRVSDPAPLSVRDPADPSCGKALVP